MRRIVLLLLALLACLGSVLAERQQVLNPGLDNTLDHIRYEAATAPDPPSHVTAKQKVLQTLKKDNPDADVKDSHPRYWLLRALYGFWRHGERFQQDVVKKSTAYSELSPEHRRVRFLLRRRREDKAQKLIKIIQVIEETTDYAEIYGKVYERYKVNGELSRDIAKVAMDYYQVTELELQQYISVQEYNEQWDNQERVNEALQHVYRDWTREGEHERANASAAILQILEKQFPDRQGDPIKVLCPGSGLGRIPQNIAALGGFDVTANELSSYMRIAYRFMESLQYAHQVVFHPFMDWWSYQPNRYEMIRPVTFPDKVVNKTSVLLVEGDFTEEFDEHQDHFDAIVTFYFMDTATNMLEYFDVLHKLLKPGGLWINLGPLLYHDASVELSLDDMLRVAEGYGFQFVETDERWGPLTLEHRKARTMWMSYMVHEKSIRTNSYKAQLFAAIKRR